MRGDRAFRRGDKVMQLKNDYDRNVFNGDIGVIESVDPQGGVIRVDFDGKLATYERAELDQLVHAYAVSVHKSQGSEYPAVVIPLVTQHFMMLQRSLLYTAVTRGKQLVVLVGSRRAVSLAVQQRRRAQALHVARRADPRPRRGLADQGIGTVGPVAVCSEAWTKPRVGRCSVPPPAAGTSSQPFTPLGGCSGR